MTPMYSLDPPPFPILSFEKVTWHPGWLCSYLSIAGIMGPWATGPDLHSLRDEAQSSMHPCGALTRWAISESLCWLACVWGGNPFYFYLHSSITSSWQHPVRLDSELKIIWKRWMTLVNSHRGDITHWGFIFLIPKTLTLETGQGLHLAK